MVRTLTRFPGRAELLGPGGKSRGVFVDLQKDGTCKCDGVLYPSVRQMLEGTANLTKNDSMRYTVQDAAGENRSSLL